MQGAPGKEVNFIRMYFEFYVLCQTLIFFRVELVLLASKETLACLESREIEDLWDHWDRPVIIDKLY